MRYGVAGAALLGLLLAWPATGAHVPCDRRQAEEALNRFDEAVSALSENAQERFLERHARELDALEAAQCSDILEKLPQGLDTVIGTKGIYLSGGEAQRIALARAILKDAPIVVLDEATAFADPENEVLIQKAFARLTKGRTVIMIAHRLSTVVGADKILVLDGGRVVEQGTHQELAAAGGLYARMWSDYNQAIQWKMESGSGKEEK